MIDIGHIPLYKEGSEELPLDNSQWPRKNTYIKCMVCYYRDKGKQLGLSWLGETSQLEPEKNEFKLDYRSIDIE